jgi:hypothetical protein
MNAISAWLARWSTLPVSTQIFLAACAFLTGLGAWWSIDQLSYLSRYNMCMAFEKKSSAQYSYADRRCISAAGRRG